MIGILVTARLGSSRLARKHLLPAGGRPIITYLLRRIVREFKPEIDGGEAKLIIATSDESENRAFEVFGEASVFYGSSNNIPRRHHPAAVAHNLPGIVSVDGEDILCSRQAMRVVYEGLRRGEKCIRTSGLPLGLNAWGYSRRFLEESLAEQRGDDALETGWGRIFAPEEIREIAVACGAFCESLRFTLDYEEDYRFFSALIDAFGDDIIGMDDEGIVRYAQAHELYRLTDPIARVYWENFHNARKREEEG